MGTARRLYLYTVSLVGLLALTGGIGALIQLALQRLSDTISGQPAIEAGINSTQAALSVAMIVVGGSTWALHWWLARRGMRGTSADGLEDRASAARGWYLTVVLGIALTAAMTALIGIGTVTAQAVLGVGSSGDWPTPMAVALVAVPTWALHARMRWHEIRTTRMHGAAAWTTRLYRYLAAYACLLVALLGLSGILATALSVLVGRSDFGQGEAWWREVVAGQLSAAAIGALALALHWREAATTIRDATAIGEDERRTRLRAAFFGGSLLTATAYSAVVAADAVANAGRLLTGITSGGTQAWLEDVVGPPIAVIPFAAAACWLFLAVRREARDMGPAEVLAARRLTVLLPSLVGLALLAVGTANLIETALLRVAGGTETVLYGQSPDDQVPWLLAQIFVGLGLWLPAWGAELTARRQHPAEERIATASRGYLFLVMGAVLVTGVPAAIAVLYRLLLPLLGGAESNPALADLAFPVSVLVVAVLGGAYHARLLLGDLASAGPETMPAAPSQETASTAPSEPATFASGAAGLEAASPADGDRRRGDVGPRTLVELLLEVPTGTDAPALVAALESHLPPGATIRVAHAGLA